MSWVLGHTIYDEAQSSCDVETMHFRNVLPSLSLDLSMMLKMRFETVEVSTTSTKGAPLVSAAFL